MVDIEVILRSQAEYSSQVHPTLVANKAKSLCINYRTYTAAIQGMGWPIPSIPQMLQQLEV